MSSMYTTVAAAKMGDLPFWDEARAGQLTFVGCFPDEGTGDDCPHDAAILGTMGADGVFRCEKGEFMPSADIWRCGHDGKSERLEILDGADGRGWRPAA